MFEIRRHSGLPQGWSIELKPALNLTSITLVDDSGRDRVWGVCPTPIDAAQHVRQVRSIAAPEIRAKVRELLRRHITDMQTGYVTLRAFVAGVPDASSLLDQLQLDLPGATVACGVTGDSTVVNLEITTTGLVPAAAAMALLADWARDNDHIEIGARSADGVETEFCEGAFSAVLTTDHARCFLGWYRGRLTAALPTRP